MAEHRATITYKLITSFTIRSIAVFTITTLVPSITFPNRPLKEDVAATVWNALSYGQTVHDS